MKSFFTKTAGIAGSFSDLLSDGTASGSGLPYDLNGNVRVIRLFWKSRRKILRVKYYDADGAGQFKLRDETYVPDREAGEEAVSLWVNQAWEGVKIGSEVYVNMRPRLVQYNTLSNPSRCHFGIVGSVYSLNEAKPFSVVDRVTAIIDRRHEETVARRIEASPRIGSLLTDLRLSLDADRVFLLEAHNGSRSYSAVRPGVPFLKDEYINTKIERYNFAGLLVDSPSGFWYGTVDSLEDACPELCWRLRGDNAERFAMVLMTTPSGAPYAALGLEYNPGTEARDTAEVFTAMLRCSLAAGMILNAGK